MQLNFLPPNVNPTPTPENQSKKNPRTANGTKESASRYSKLKATLDRDLIANNQWCEVDTTAVSNAPCNLSYVDLFSGAGGLSLGAQQSGLRKALSIEIDPDASDTIRRNFPQSQHLEMPIEEVSPETLHQTLQGRQVNIVFGGPPCGGFSVAGLRNLQDPRNRLFQEYIRLVEHINPDYVVMENVPGILSIDHGKVKTEILRQFAQKNNPVRRCL